MQKVIIFSGRFLFRTASIFIFLCNLFVLCVYAYLRCSSYGRSDPAPYSVELLFWQKIILILGIFALFIAGVVLYWPRRQKQAAIHSKLPWFRNLFTLLSVGFFLYLIIDSPPPKQMFTRQYLEPKNLSLPTKELDTIFYSKKEKVPDVRYLLRDGKSEDIEAYTTEIEGGWKYIISQRAAVEQLSKRDAVFHRVEDGYKVPMPLSGMRVGAIYQSYALLRARQGDLQGAVEVLSQFHDVACKGLEGSVDLLQKMIWTAAIGNNLRTALQLAYEYTLDEPLRKMLVATFDPITNEEASFFKPWIGEYLSFQRALDYSFTELIVDIRYNPQRNPVYLIAKQLPEQLVAFVFGLTMQKNRSAQLLYDFWVPVIHTAMLETYGQHAIQEKDFYPPIAIRNVGGWYFYQPPQFLRYEERLKDAQVQSELLYFFLKDEQRVTAGRLQDIANNGLRDAGKDEKLGTKDDVALELYYPVETQRK